MKIILLTRNYCAASNHFSTSPSGDDRDLNCAHIHFHRTTAVTAIPLEKIVELRESWRHGLKTRKDYDIAKESFLATKNPGQRQQQTATAHMAQMTEAKTIDTMANSNVKIFYGDYSRNDEDPMAWMQSLNTRKVANDWADTKAISIFESLLVEDKKAYRWWHKDLKGAELTMDKTDWAAVRKEFKRRWPPLLEHEEDLEAKR